MAYTKTVWVNNSQPYLNADNLNKIENQLEELDGVKYYSTSETNTGKIWINNKPIYRKVIYVQSLPNSTTATINHSISNVNNIWCNGEASFIIFGNGDTAPVPYIGGTSFYSMIEVRGVNATSFSIDSHSTDRRNCQAYIILEYTKTTD